MRLPAWSCLACLGLLLSLAGCVRLAWPPALTGDSLADSDRSPGGDGSPADAGREGSTRLTFPEDCSEPLWPAPPVLIRVAPGESLADRIAAAQPGATILLAAGRHLLRTTVRLSAPGLILRGEQAAEPVIDAGGMAPALVVEASGVVLAGFSIENSPGTAIEVNGAPDGDITSGVVLYGLRVAEANARLIRVSTAEGPHSDSGLIACCRLEVSDALRTAAGAGCRVVGIALEGARGWQVRDNLLRGFRCLASATSGAAVVVGAGSRDTVVERNRILDSFHGVRFGNLTFPINPRTYSDGGCSYPASPIQVYGGVIRNNFISALRPDMDTGINLWHACDTRVLHNTAIFGDGLYSSIEWRFTSTRVTVLNNLTSHPTRIRDGATAEVGGNLESAVPGWFVDAPAGDLHLGPGPLPPVGAGMVLAAGDCDQDIDRQLRSGARDVGADQR